MMPFTICWFFTTWGIRISHAQQIICRRISVPLYLRNVFDLARFQFVSLIDRNAIRICYFCYLSGSNRYNIWNDLMLFHGFLDEICGV
uniref:Secreted protein n=1 Tax=Lotus japonicus TaxID=34305 RepID=I3S7D9_LOTJA|nr:unknown [Lotus japonicus]